MKRKLVNYIRGACQFGVYYKFDESLVESIMKRAKDDQISFEKSLDLTLTELNIGAIVFATFLIMCIGVSWWLDNNDFSDVIIILLWLGVSVGFIIMHSINYKNKFFPIA